LIKTLFHTNAIFNSNNHYDWRGIKTRALLLTIEKSAPEKKHALIAYSTLAPYLSSLLARYAMAFLSWLIALREAAIAAALCPPKSWGAASM